MAFLPPSDSAAVFTLLAVLADPDTYKSRLTELQRLSEDAQAKLDAVGPSYVAVEQRLKEATAERDEAQRLREDASQEVTDARERLAARERVVQKREDEVYIKEVSLRDREEAAKKAEVKTDEVSVQLAKLTKEAIAREKEADDTKRLYEAKLQKLKDLV